MRILDFVIAVFIFIPAFFIPARGAAGNAEIDSTLFGKTIRTIEYSAERTLDRSHYDPYLGIKPGDLLTRTGVKQAIQFLYETGRFSQIIVEAFPDGGGVNLRLGLRHSYFFNKFSISRNVDLKGRSLWELIALPAGQRFTEDRLEEARQAVLKFMQEKGFYLAQVKARVERDEDSLQVDTVFEVNPGELATIRSIEITGVPAQGSEALLDKLGFRKGKKYDRSRLSNSLRNLRRYFINKGRLAAVAQMSESFEPETNTVGLTLNVSNFGAVRVVVEGFKIDKDQLRRLLPILAGEGINQEILEEGMRNLKEHLESKGYPEAEVYIRESQDDSGTRVFHYVIIPSNKFTVAYVRFRGNHVFTGDELLASVEIQPAHFFQSTAYSVTHLDSDVDLLKAMYESRGYLEAKIIPLIEPFKEGKRLGITYACEEGRLSQIRSLNIGGNAAISTKELMSKIGLAPAGPYSPSLVERGRQNLLAAYNDLGFLQAQVTYRVGTPDEANTYPVEFKILEGTQSRVERILILGAEQTRRSVIGKRIALSESGPLSLGKLLQTQQALYRLGVFDQVRVAPQNSESIAPFQDVVVRLQESRRFTVRYGFGYQEREKLRGTIEFTDLNILGTARRADLRLRGSSIEQEALLSFQQPQFRAIPVDSYFTLSALQRSDISFDSRRFNLSYQFSHPFSSHSWGMLRYNFKNVKLSNLKVSASEVGREDSPRNFSTFSAAFINDSRDNYLDPSKGFFSSTDFGVTTKLLGNNDYVSFFTQNSYYQRLPESLMMAFSLRIGAAHPYGGDPNLPISERFFAGGGSSLRGFETDYAGPLDPVTNHPLGGNGLVVGSMEIRAPVFRFIHMAGFYDTGNVFRSISDINFAGFSHSLGIGLRVKTPFGPLRADYGYNLNLSSDLQRRGLTRRHLFITVGPPF